MIAVLADAASPDVVVHGCGGRVDDVCVGALHDDDGLLVVLIPPPRSATRRDAPTRQRSGARVQDQQEAGQQVVLVLKCVIHIIEQKSWLMLSNYLKRHITRSLVKGCDFGIIDYGINQVAQLI